MMFNPRWYQAGAVDALFEYWGRAEGSPLIDLATGAGKSPVMAMIIMQLLEGWPSLRIMVVTHVKELIEQNFEELMNMWPYAPAGIYSAGLRKKQFKAQILFGGIQTCWNKVDQIGHVDIVMIDECHLIPPDTDTQYGQFFKALRELNPDLKIVGLTATPYRLDSGRLDEGEDRLFDEIIYTYSVGQGVEDGYLTPLRTPQTSIEYVVPKGTRKNKEGDHQKKALDELMRNATEVNEKAVAEIVNRGVDRRSWMCFCSGIKHADDIRDEIRNYGISCETISGDMEASDRKRILKAYKNYEIRCLTNNGVLTTGFNHKGVDLIAFMRPTLSVSLYLQMAGRGTRVLYAPGWPLDTAEQRRAAIAAGPKPNCLVLDFARLVNEHGPVDNVKVKGPPGEGSGEAPCKICPTDKYDNPKRDADGYRREPKLGCGEKVHASVRVCKECGFEFEFNSGPKIEADAHGNPIMTAGAVADWRDVWNRSLSYNASKSPGKPDTVKVSYKMPTGMVMDWLSPDAAQVWLKNKFRKFWRDHGGANPCPRSALETIERQGELRKTMRIKVKPKNGYWQVEDYEVHNPDAPDHGEALEVRDELPY